jgi:acetyl-CoA carboxylase biotin carboxyl carrier protein
VSDHDKQAAVSDASTENGIEDQERLANLVNSFISMMKTGNMARLDLEYRDLRLSLRAHGDATANAPVAVRTPVAVAAHDGADHSADGDSYIISAPMIGTFYTASAPNEPPFVQPGDHIQEGQTIGIIEAMKIMNEIASDRGGTVLEIVAQNAQSVEYGSPLVRIEPDPS